MRKSELADLWNEVSNGCKWADSILPRTGRGGQSATRDYVAATCKLQELIKAGHQPSEFNSWKEASKVLNPAVRFRLGMYGPMLCSRFSECTEAQQNNMLDNQDAVWTEKINGVRAVVIFFKGQWFFFSRNYSVDCSLPEYHNNVYQFPKYTDHLKELDPQGIIALDCECVFEPGADISNDLEELGLSTDSQLEAMSALLQTYPQSAFAIQKKFKEKYGRDLVTFRLIHPLYYRGRNYIKRTLGEGMKVYNECVSFAQEMGLNVKPIKMCDGDRNEKSIFLDTILNEGGEGVVIHFKSGQYHTTDQRYKDCFVKLKRSLSLQQNKLADTIDCFISGFKMGTEGTANEGIVGALEGSIYILKPNGEKFVHHICSVPNIPLATRKEMTIIGEDGKPTLDPAVYDLVMEVDGQSLSAKSVRISHPSLVRMRLDKLPADCVYSQEFIDSMTENVGLNYGNKAKQAKFGKKS